MPFPTNFRCSRLHTRNSVYIRSQLGDQNGNLSEEIFMRPFFLAFVLAVGIAMLASLGLAQKALTPVPYNIVKTAKVDGEGGFDYVFADPAGRRLYVPRSGPTARITVFDLDTLEPTGEIANVNGHGVVVDSKTHHGFVTSKPVVMFHTN